MTEERIIPIGRVRSAVVDRLDAPRQGRDAGTEVEIEIFPPFVPGLAGLARRERVIVVCWMHLARRDLLTVPARGQPGAPPRGVFGTRSPNRPNPLGVYTAELLGVDGSVLRVRGIDAVDGTPVLDVRPHVPRLDDACGPPGAGRSPGG